MKKLKYLFCQAHLGSIGLATAERLVAGPEKSYSETPLAERMADEEKAFVASITSIATRMGNNLQASVDAVNKAIGYQPPS
jgi:hypothetical protein